MDEMDTSRHLRAQMHALWVEQKLCDVEIKAGTSTVRCHRLVLAASSPFFR